MLSSLLTFIPSVILRWWLGNREVVWSVKSCSKFTFEDLASPGVVLEKWPVKEKSKVGRLVVYCNHYLHS